VSDLLCIVYYRDSDVEVRSREDWLRAPFRDVQAVKHRWGSLKYIEAYRWINARDTPWQWAAGEQFWVWRPDQERPFGCDWMEMADHMRQLGVLAHDAPLLSLSMADLERAGVKYGLNLVAEDWERVYYRAKADERI
jgi:hypothetical protein